MTQCAGIMSILVLAKCSLCVKYTNKSFLSVCFDNVLNFSGITLARNEIQAWNLHQYDSDGMSTLINKQSTPQLIRFLSLVYFTDDVSTFVVHLSIKLSTQMANNALIWLPESLGLVLCNSNSTLRETNP